MTPAYSSDWFTPNRWQFERNFKDWPAGECHILEIGCYEGRATSWMLANLACDPKSTITCVDIKEQPAFRTNLGPEGHKVELLLGYSCEILPTLPKNKFDFIYIDGGHTSIDVIEDAVLSFRLAKIGALIAFDDYKWRDPDGGSSPKSAIDAFLKAYRGHVELISRNYQVWTRKIRV
jgi:predicted O-methyltransferase YrrM